MVYLDVAATTKPKQEVIDAMMPYLTEKWHNPSSLYSTSVQVKNDIENARKTIGEFINADAGEIYPTSGGSESNCWAIQGFVNNYPSPVVITSSIEHKSIMSCVDNIHATVEHISVDSNGFVDIESLREKIIFYKATLHNVLVSIQFANNEIGTIQDIKTIAGIAHRHGALFHVDAVQAFSQIPIDVKKLGIDMLSASGHKLGAPKGVGILYIKNGVKIKPLIYGSQMDGMRGGTENVPYIIGMAKAVELAKSSVKLQSRISLIRSYFIGQLESIGCELNGSSDNRLPNNINVILPEGISGESLLYMMDLSAIMIATGSACNSRSVEPSYVLKAIGLSDEQAARSVRITFSSDITREEIDDVIEEMEKCFKLLKD